MHLTRNQAYLHGYRGFKSLPLRQHTKQNPTGLTSSLPDQELLLRLPEASQRMLGLNPAT